MVCNKATKKFQRLQLPKSPNLLSELYFAPLTFLPRATKNGRSRDGDRYLAIQPHYVSITLMILSHTLLRFKLNFKKIPRQASGPLSCAAVFGGGTFVP